MLVNQSATVTAPLSVDSAIDLLIAVSAHDSSVDAQQEFGRHIYKDYFDRLLTQYEGDRVAFGYLTEIFASLSAAARGFAVARRVFATTRKTRSDAREIERQSADRLLQYSPLTGSSIFGKIASAISGGGLLGIIAAFIGSSKTNSVRVELIALGGAVGISIGVIGMDYLLHHIRKRRYDAIQQQYPEFDMETWERDTVRQYRAVTAAFARSCLALEEKYYPAESAARPAVTPSYIEAIVTQHFPLANSSTHIMQITAQP